MSLTLILATLKIQLTIADVHWGCFWFRHNSCFELRACRGAARPRKKAEKKTTDAKLAPVLSLDSVAAAA